MNLLLHLLFTTILIYFIVSYLLCGFLLFFPGEATEEILEPYSFGQLFVIWTLSPFIIGSMILDKFLGR